MLNIAAHHANVVTFGPAFIYLFVHSKNSFFGPVPEYKLY